jgi:dienelactone hydrolase
MPHPFSPFILCLGLLGVAVAHAAEPAAPRFVHGAALAPPLVGDLYLPVGSPAKLGVLVLGGAEGGVPSGAKFLASKGYAALAIAYFKAPGLPDTLEQIPLEYLDQALAWLEASPGVPRGGIVIEGGSKGAELALLLASRHPDVIGVIATSPSSVVWQGLAKSFWPKPVARSSWTLQGQPLPFVPYDYGHFFNPLDSRALYKFYDRSLAQKEAAALAAIPVEKIHGPVLLLTGRDDRLWPSTEMGDRIRDRLKAAGFPYKFEHIAYQNAGHTLNESAPVGGTMEGNRAARIASRAKILEFLQQIAPERAPAGPGSN